MDLRPVVSDLETHGALAIELQYFNVDFIANIDDF